MLTDTHAHLYYPELESQLEAVLQRAAQAGVGRVIAPAVDLETSIKLTKMCLEQDQLYCALGIHPCDAAKAKEDDITEIAKLMASYKVVAVGETGLDYYWDTSTKELQKHMFREQIRMAATYDLPVIVHTRDSLDDALHIIEEEYGRNPVKAHFHCFSGSIEQLERCLSVPDLHISFCGNITYKRSELTEAVQGVPSDRLLSETDSPFLAPMPFRGKTNEPSYMIHTIEKIAQIKNKDVEDLKNTLAANAEKFFRLTD